MLHKKNSIKFFFKMLCHKKFFTKLFCHTIFSSPKFEYRFLKKILKVGAASQGVSRDANQRGIHPMPQIHGKEITPKYQKRKKGKLSQDRHFKRGRGWPRGRHSGLEGVTEFPKGVKEKTRGSPNP
jgi:hypothetical protein